MARTKTHLSVDSVRAMVVDNGPQPSTKSLRFIKTPAIIAGDVTLLITNAISVIMTREFCTRNTGVIEPT